MIKFAYFSMWESTKLENWLSGNLLVKSNISKSKFDVFDIREDFGLNIQNMRENHLLGFSIQRLWAKSLEIARNFSIGPLFSK